MRVYGVLTVLGMFAGPAMAAPPGSFTESANVALLAMPNRVTPDPMDLNAPMQCIDTNGNGRDEIIGGGFIDSIWRVLEQRPDGQGFSVSAGARRPFPTTSDGANQGRALLIDTTSSPGQPKLYAQIFESLEYTARYDLRTRKLESVALLLSNPIGIRDIDGDGVGELIAFQSTSSANFSLLKIYDAQMSRLLASFELRTGVQQAVALGNFDDDPRWEVASSAGVVYELTLDAIREEGTFAERVDGNWIDYMAAGDVDGDGKDEIVAAYYSEVAVIDHDQRAVKWSKRASVNPSAFVNALRTIDLIGNGTPEVVIGQVGAGPAAPGNFVIFDGASGSELRTIEHSDVSVFGVNACDVDGDGRRDLIAGLTRPITGPDRLYVYDPDSGQLKWRSIDEIGIVRAATMVDTDADGQQEIIFAPYEVFGAGDLRLHAYDASTLAHRWTTDSPMLPQPGAGSLNALAAGDADGDGDIDLVVGSSQGNGGRVWVVDARTRALVRTIGFGESGTQVRAVALVNVAGDAAPEIIAARSDGVLNVIPGVGDTPVFRGSWGTTEARGLQTADFNTDGTTDVLLRVAPYIPGQTELFVFDGASQNIRSLNTGCASSILPLDVVGSSAPEVVVGGCDGVVRVIDAVGGSLLQSHNVCAASTPINAIARNNLSTAGAREVLFTCRDRIGWLSLANGQHELITAVVGDQIGVGNNLFSGRTAANVDFVAVSTIEGITQLQPSAALTPWVWPFNPTTTNIYSVGVGLRLTESITFGAFDGAPVTLEVVQQPRHGRLTVSNAQTGQFQYDSTDSYVGIDLMVVQARTPLGVSAPTAIPISIRDGGPGTMPSPSNPNPPSNGGGGGGGGGAIDSLAIAVWGLLLLLRHVTNLRRPRSAARR